MWLVGTCSGTRCSPTRRISRCSACCRCRAARSPRRGWPRRALVAGAVRSPASSCRRRWPTGWLAARIRASARAGASPWARRSPRCRPGCSSFSSLLAVRGLLVCVVGAAAAAKAAVALQAVAVVLLVETFLFLPGLMPAGGPDNRQRRRRGMGAAGLVPRSVRDVRRTESGAADAVRPAGDRRTGGVGRRCRRCLPDSRRLERPPRDRGGRAAAPRAADWRSGPRRRPRPAEAPGPGDLRVHRARASRATGGR